MQIAAIPDGDGSRACLFALADDSTLWTLPFAQDAWFPVPNIPQPEEDEK